MFDISKRRKVAGSPCVRVRSPLDPSGLEPICNSRNVLGNGSVCRSCKLMELSHKFKLVSAAPTAAYLCTILEQPSFLRLLLAKLSTCSEGKKAVPLHLLGPYYCCPYTVLQELKAEKEYGGTMGSGTSSTPCAKFAMHLDTAAAPILRWKRSLY